MSGPTTRESDKFMLRLPDGMRDRIKAAADANNRSMNAEIVATLEEKYPAPPSRDVQKDVENLEEEIARIRAEIRGGKMDETAAASGHRMISSLENLVAVLRKAYLT